MNTNRIKESRAFTLAVLASAAVAIPAALAISAPSPAPSGGEVSGSQVSTRQGYSKDGGGARLVNPAASPDEAKALIAGASLDEDAEYSVIVVTDGLTAGEARGAGAETVVSGLTAREAKEVASRYIGDNAAMVRIARSEG